MEPNIQSVQAHIKKDKKESFYIPSLDGIRAFAFLIVFIAHIGLEKFVPGGFGVTIFFFLSGYLITTLVRREYERNVTINFKNFYLRRVLRIFPPFYLVLIVSLILTKMGFLAGKLELPGVLAQVLHYYNYQWIYHSSSGVTPGSSIYWSLAVEEHFYLLFPIAYFVLLKMKMNPRQQGIVFLAACLGFLVWRCILFFIFDQSGNRILYASDTRFDSIIFGCILAVYGNPILDKEFYNSEKSEKLLKQVLFPLAIILILASLLYRSPVFRETLRYTVQGAALYPLFIIAIKYPNWTICRIFNVKWIGFIGTLSYSLYLVHFLVIKGLIYHIPSLNLISLTFSSLIISFIISLGIYKYVENPIAKLRKKFRT